MRHHHLTSIQVTQQNGDEVDLSYSQPDLIISSLESLTWNSKNQLFIYIYIYHICCSCFTLKKCFYISHPFFSEVHALKNHANLMHFFFFFLKAYIYIYILYTFSFYILKKKGNITFPVSLIIFWYIFSPKNRKQNEQFVSN